MELRGNIVPVGRVTGTLNTGARLTGNIVPTVNHSKMTGTVAPVGRVTGSLSSGDKMRGTIRAPSTVTNRDYERLYNKPQINSVELIGNKSLPDIGVDVISNMELEELLQ